MEREVLKKVAKIIQEITFNTIVIGYLSGFNKYKNKLIEKHRKKAKLPSLLSKSKSWPESIVL